MRQIAEITKNDRISQVEHGEDGFRCRIKMPGYSASLIVSTGAGWEHASISPLRKITPSWDDMCLLKDIIWNDDEEVIQIHPAKDKYINNLSNCLHLWRCTYKEMVMPPSCLVGIRKGQTRQSLEVEAKEAYRIAEGQDADSN